MVTKVKWKQHMRLKRNDRVVVQLVSKRHNMDRVVVQLISKRHNMERRLKDLTKASTILALRIRLLLMGEGML